MGQHLGRQITSPGSKVGIVATGKGKVREIQGKGKVRDFCTGSGKF